MSPAPRSAIETRFGAGELRFEGLPAPEKVEPTYISGRDTCNKHRTLTLLLYFLSSSICTLLWLTVLHKSLDISRTHMDGVCWREKLLSLLVSHYLIFEA